MAALNKVLVSDDVEVMSEPGGDHTSLFTALGKGGVLNLLLDLARNNAATLSVMEGSNRKWPTVGPYEGAKLHYDPTRGTLRITRKKRTSHSGPQRSLAHPARALDLDPGVVPIGEEYLPDYDDLGNPIEDECAVVPKVPNPPPAKSSPIFQDSPWVAEWTLECKA